MIKLHMNLFLGALQMEFISTYENQEPYIKRRCTITVNERIKELLHSYLDASNLSLEEALYTTYDSLFDKIKYSFYDPDNDEFSTYVLTERENFLNSVVITEPYLDKLLKARIYDYYHKFIHRKPSPRQLEYFNDLQKRVGIDIESPINNYLFFLATLEHLIKKSKEMDEEQVRQKELELTKKRMNTPASENQVETLVWLYNSNSENSKTITKKTLKNLSCFGAQDLFNIARTSDPKRISELMENYIATQVPAYVEFTEKVSK